MSRLFAKVVDVRESRELLAEKTVWHDRSQRGQVVIYPDSTLPKTGFCCRGDVVWRMESQSHQARSRAGLLQSALEAQELFDRQVRRLGTWHDASNRASILQGFHRNRLPEGFGCRDV